MNSRDALDVLETMAAEGAIRRVSSDNRLTKGIRYEIPSGQQLQLDLGNAVARLEAGRLRLDDAGQNRATLVLENDPEGIVPSSEEASIAGVQYRSGMPFNGSHYKDAGSRLTPDRQALFYVDTAEGLRQLLSLYERHSRGPIDKLKQRFLATFPDFESAGAFAATTGAYHDTYRKRVDALLAEAAQHPADGWAVLHDVLAASEGGRGALPPFFDGDVNWRVRRARDVNLAGFDAALDALVAGQGNTVAAAVKFNETFRPTLEAIGEPKTFRDTRVVPSTVLAAVAPDKAISVRYTPYAAAERLLNDRMLFANKVMSAEEYRAVLALAEQIRAAMIGWGWAPRDLWDVHGFILATCGKQKDAEMDDAALLRRFSSPYFDAFCAGWTPEQSKAFCTIARAAHEVGLDWYHTKMVHNPVRLGRKPHVDRRAKAAAGYLNQPKAPRILINEASATPEIGIGEFPLDQAGAEAFVDAVRKHHPQITARSMARRSGLQRR